MSALFSLSQQVALITGATGYLGQSMALALAEAGAKVYINARNTKKVEQLVSQIKDQGLQAEPAVFDVTDVDQTSAFFTNFSEEKLNILINNAYVGGGASTCSSSDEQFHESYKVTLVAAQRLLKYSLPLMKIAAVQDQNANCLNISSMYGLVSPEQQIYGEANKVNPPFYGAAKAALIQWTKYVASEFAGQGIRVNCISPGAFPSQHAQQNVELMNKLKSKVPLGRFGQPNELQGAVLFLASKASSYVTGHNLTVDGGWTIR